MVNSENIVQNKTTLITVMGTSKDTKDDRGLPWYYDEPAPTDEVIEKIVFWFPEYAVFGRGNFDSKNQQLKRIAHTFVHCTGYAKEYFKDKAMQLNTKEVRDEVKDKVRDIANKGMELVDEFYDWFEKVQDQRSYYNMCSRWHTVLRSFNMCMNSGNQAKKPAEIKQDIAPAKRRGARKWIKRLGRELYGLTIERITKAYLDKYG